MTDNNNKGLDSMLNDDFLSAFDFSDKTKRVINKRTSVRYVRNDIDVTVSSSFPFNFTQDKKVKLINISSRGMLLETKHSFGLNKVLDFNLRFRAGKEFKIKGKIVNNSVLASANEGVKHYYGIKFERQNDELGDYLLETQEKLILK